MNNASVSVLMPSYNHQAYVCDAITSVLEQTHKNVEVVIVDDCSSDGTVEAIQSICDNRIKFARNEKNLGVNRTLARALDMSSGSYISVLASDDMLFPMKIERQLIELRRTDTNVVYASSEILEPNGRRSTVNLQDFADDLANGKALGRAYVDDTSLPLFQSALFTRSSYEYLAPFRDQVRLDDWITLIKALETQKVSFINEPLCIYRHHAANTHQQYEKTFGMRLEVIATATPIEFQKVALSNLYASQAKYLAWDGKFGACAKASLVSQILRPNINSLTGVLRAVAYRLRSKKT